MNTSHFYSAAFAAFLSLNAGLQAHDVSSMPRVGGALSRGFKENARDTESARSWEKKPAFVSSHRIVEYDLTVEETTMAPAAKPVSVLTINGSYPGPTLRFQEGDTARIRVHNRLPRGETSVHWHGLLLPNDQDGVPHLTTPPVLPGQTFTYEFPIRQSGTYWYHSHTGLQEQRGVLGSIVITPRGGEPVRADRDEVLVLTDWSNESPEEILRTLKRGSNWYPIRKGASQSLMGAARAGFLGEYLKREKSRIPPMDLSDVAYDAFLMNGAARFPIHARPGETVRLRLINASASSYFYVQSATGPLKIIAADGQAVRPLPVSRLLMGVAETYDVLVKVPPSGAWEVRATAQDGSGKACAVLGSGDFHAAPEVPRPNLYDMDTLLMTALEEGDLTQEKEAVSEAKKGRGTPMPQGAKDKKETCTTCAERPLPPYRGLRALRPTAFAPGLPRRTLELHLTGDMQRYVWSLNGKTIDEESVIPVKRGEVLRLELVNDTMMHHPMHPHGHFFRLINGQGDYAPLKHTEDVPPMSRRIIEFEANEPGDWMFHCHVLYHMMEGMARVIRYEPAAGTPHASTASAAPQHAPGSGALGHAKLGEHAMPMWHAFAEGSLLSNMSEGVARIQSGRNSLRLPWELGWLRTDGHTKYEADALLERAAGANWGLLGGMRWSNLDSGGNRPLAGAWYRMPYLVKGTATVDGKGAGRLALEKEVQLDSRLNLVLKAQYDTQERWQESVRLDYTLSKRLALSTGYHSDYGLGAGLSFKF